MIKTKNAHQSLLTYRAAVAVRKGHFMPWHICISKCPSGDGLIREVLAQK